MFSSNSRYFRVDRRELVYLKFILEAYEGLAVLSTVDPEAAIVRVAYPFFFEDDVDNLMRALREEIGLTEVPIPEGFRDGLPDLPERKVIEHAG